jgi:lipoprotein-releasing system permease protein
VIYFELKLAARHLLYGRGQTLLTMVAVAVAVVAIVFIQSLISGVKQIILNDLLSSLPDVTVRARDRQPHALAAERPQLADVALFTRVQKQGPKRNEIEGWQGLAAQAARFPHVRAVASVALGNADLVRGEKRIGVAVTGADPGELDRLIGLQQRVVAGNWLQIKPDEIAIGWKLAEEANVQLGDRIRLETPSGSGNYRLAAILSANDQLSVYTRLRTAQSLFGLRRNVSRLYLKLDTPFAADDTAQLMGALLPYRVDSWTRENGNILGVFKAQDGTSLLVSLFSLFGSAFAVASVLIISVTQKSKQIGILKSMGAQAGQILRVFTCEALLIGSIGSLLGAVCAYGMIYAVNQIPNAPSAAQPFAQSDRLFRIDFQPLIYITACVVATLATVLAALLPARRAARLDPVQAIRS